MSLKEKIFYKVADTLRTGNIHRFYKTTDDSRPSSKFKLVFFCGANGINYLNASLVSVHKYWNTLPNILIISDGTPVEKIRNQLLPWPRTVDIISWEEAATHFSNQGNEELATYAKKDLWGKKFISILYCASKFPTFYSDTDILWFSNPEPQWTAGEPIMKMSEDISHCYSEVLLQQLHQNKINSTPPLNAGLIFANGDFSSFPDWKQLCDYLANKPDNRTEQTSFAILNNHFNQNNYFNHDEVLIKVDDGYSLKFTGSKYKNIFARHYVNIKATTFWRDFTYMLLMKKRNH